MTQVLGIYLAGVVLASFFRGKRGAGRVIWFGFG